MTTDRHADRRHDRHADRRPDEDLAVPTGASLFMAEAWLAAHEELAQLED